MAKRCNGKFEKRKYQHEIDLIISQHLYDHLIAIKLDGFNIALKLPRYLANFVTYILVNTSFFLWHDQFVLSTRWHTFATVLFLQYIYFNSMYESSIQTGASCPGRIIVGFLSTLSRCQFTGNLMGWIPVSGESYSIQSNQNKNDSDVRSVSGFFQVSQFSLSIDMTVTIQRQFSCK